MSADDRIELDAILSALCDRELTESEHARLERLLDDSGCRQRYLEYVDMHAHLQNRTGSVAGGVKYLAETKFRRHHGWYRVAIGAAVAVCVMVLIQVLYFRSAEGGNRVTPLVVKIDGESDVPLYVATLTRADNCVWGDGGPVAVGARIVPSELRLKSGVARIVFDSGASLILEGGSAIRVESRTAATVLAGKVVFRGDDVPEVFNLRTPRSLLQDFGTEYAVVVTPDLEEVHVFDGEVRRSTPTGRKSEWQLNAGEARRFKASSDDTGSPAELDPNGFIRSLPPLPRSADPNEGLLAYDGFDYAADWGLTAETHNAANAGYGWNGPWVKALARPKPPVKSPAPVFNPLAGLSRVDAAVVPVGGSFDFTGFSKAHRRLTTPVRMDADAVYYLSFLFRREGPQADPLNSVSVLFRETAELEADMKSPIPVDPRKRMNFGVCRRNDVYTNLNRVGRHISLPMSYGQTYLCVAKIVAGKTMPDQTFVRVYGPDELVDWEEPTEWSVAGQQVHSDLVFDWLEVHINSQTRQTLDEVRLGTTWTAVAHPWIGEGAPVD